MCVRDSYTSLFANDRASDLEHSVAHSHWPTLLSRALPINPDSDKSDLGLAAQYLAYFLLIYLGIERVEGERALHDICLCENLFQLLEAFYV